MTIAGGMETQCRQQSGPGIVVALRGLDFPAEMLCRW